MTQRIAFFLASAAMLCVTGLHSQELEPGVQTSSSAAPVRHDPAPRAAADASHGSDSKGAVKAGAAPATRAAAAPPQSVAAAAAGGPKSARPATSDRIQLETTEISGNRELPKVMYVVPWRRADPGDFAGRPPNSLLDEALTPVDRDVFRRQNRYYSEVQGQSRVDRSQGDASNGAAAPPAAKDEK